MSKQNTQPEIVTITTKVERNGKAVEVSFKINVLDVQKVFQSGGQAAANKAIQDITKQLYSKTNDNIKLALNDNL